MLLALLDTLTRDPRSFLIMAPILLAVVGGGVLVALTIHEFAHALTATALGDPTARQQGRVSLNPLRHLDPAGTLMLLVVGFGWGRPVAFDPYRLRYGRRGIALVAGAGPVSNFATAALLALPVRAGLVEMNVSLGSALGYLFAFPGNLAFWATALFSAAFLFNVLLGTFNLLPLAPLDGFQVALGLLPLRAARALQRVGQYGMLLLFGIIAADLFLRLDLLGWVIGPVTRAVTGVLVGGVGL